MNDGPQALRGVMPEWGLWTASQPGLLAGLQCRSRTESTSTLQSEHTFLKDSFLEAKASAQLNTLDV